MHALTSSGVIPSSSHLPHPRASVVEHLISKPCFVLFCFLFWTCGNARLLACWRLGRLGGTT
eukprot:1013145-Rhodomonas_salina.1